VFSGENPPVVLGTSVEEPASLTECRDRLPVFGEDRRWVQTSGGMSMSSTSTTRRAGSIDRVEKHLVIEIYSREQQARAGGRAAKPRSTLFQHFLRDRVRVRLLAMSYDC
jgi:hypothetical protein